MARKATWQRHADPRSAYVARYHRLDIIYIFYIVWVIVHITLRLSEGKAKSNKCFFKASYNGPIPCNVAASNALIAWNTDHQPHQRTCLIGSVITVQIRSRRKHLDRRMKIQRTRFKAFYNASRGIQSGLLIKIGRSRLNRNGPRWTVSS